MTATLEPVASSKTLLNSRQVAAQLQITTRTLCRLVASGQFPKPMRLTPGSRSWVRWPQSDVEAYLDKLDTQRAR